MEWEIVYRENIASEKKEEISLKHIKEAHLTFIET